MARVDKLSNNERLELMFDLINAFSLVKNPLETANFIQDVLTANEIRNLAIRLRIAKLLLTNKTYQEINLETKTSSATITKVNAWLNRGGEGFKYVISKLPFKYKYPDKLSRGPIEYHLPEAVIKLIQYGVASSQDRVVENTMAVIKNKEKSDREFRKIVGESYALKKRRKTL